MNSTKNRSKWAIFLAIIPLLAAVQCASSNQINMEKLAKNSETPFVRECPSDFLPEPITSSEGSRELRETINSLWLAVRCGSLAGAKLWDDLKAQDALRVSQEKALATEGKASELRRCQSLPEFSDSGFPMRSYCLKVAERDPFIAPRSDESIRVEVENSAPYRFVIDSISQLCALVDKYPDSIRPDFLAKILSDQPMNVSCSR